MGETNGDMNALNTIASNSTGISEDLVASANLTIWVLEPVFDNPEAEDYKIPYARLRLDDPGSDTHGRLLDPLDGGQSQRVYIDWLDYAGLSYDQAELAIARINNLCKLLRSSKPKRLQILPTIGFVNDRTRSRFGILSCVPIERTIVSLNQILSNKRLYERLSLGNRISLARQMCWSILELHKSRWLHRGFNCSSVLFSFATKPAKQGSSLLSFSKEDFVAVGGFQYTRPVGREQVSLPIRETSIENAQLYHHPKVRENFALGDSAEGYTKYEPRYDIYSLGVVLLEIGLWKTIDQLEPKHNKDPKAFQTSLTRIAKINLPFSMGQLYTDIVICCLEGPEEAMSPGVERDTSATSINWFLYDIILVENSSIKIDLG
ncbi:hypothetical protein FAUST_8907 [Fusarium austroamericanum]|uniref:Protein kinase domain-containing protein n=1 Tax=Fusarium austroamericanum TaxID=282268 RepID=A0AAN5Z5V3_FUSAU|nr:hypothetical protein FAUST_8907 [Fusarium austroamericanum]